MQSIKASALIDGLDELKKIYPEVPEDELTKLYPLNELRVFVPRRRNKVCSIACIYRWGQIGIRGIRLEVTQVGGTKMASRADLARFFARLSGKDPSAGNVPTDRQREKSFSDAERQLEQYGI